MATVYLARDAKHHRQVAIKVLRPELAAVIGPERFEREVATLARLTHPHILPLHDSGVAEVDGRSLPYYIMPFVEGESLRDRLNREPQLSLETALRIARGVASALDYAHQRGIVHRDIKPENILLEGEEPLVADFGIARAVDAAGGERLTETGLVIGTAAYMSPEQASGSRSLDARSDVYSLGCVIYEMLAGEPPFSGPTPQAALARRLTAPPPSLRQVRELVPEATDRAIAKALARAPADRFASAGGFADALRESETAKSPGATTQRRWRRWALPLGVLGVIVAGGILLRSRREGNASLDPNLIAVSPFEVLVPSLEVYREGFVDLLSRSLDGAGPLRTVPATTAIRRATGGTDRAGATILGRQTGAGLAVSGQIVSSGRDSVRISASIIDVAAGREVGEVTVRGSADHGDILADSVSLGLLRQLGQIRHLAVSHHTSLGTSSLPALRAFLQGEQFYRASAWDSARPYYDRAVTLDSTFALGHRRLGTTLGWLGQGAEGEQEGVKAGRFNRGLPARDSLLILMGEPWGAGGDVGPDSAWALRGRKYRLLHELTGKYPDDPEAWFELGECIHHENQGTSAEEYEAFTRSIALDSAFGPSYFHLVELAISLRGIDTARAYATRFVALNSVGNQRDEESEGTRIVAALLDPLRSGSPNLGPLLDTITSTGVAAAGFDLQRWPDSAETALRLFRRLPFIRTGGLAQFSDFRAGVLASELAARGHFHEAGTINGYRLRQGWAENLTYLALFGVLPAESASVAFARELKSLARPGLVYALPWWAFRRDTASIRALHQAALTVLPRDQKRWGLRRSAYVAAASEAWLALARADTALAIQRFLALPDSLCGDCFFERVTRAQLLESARRDAEASRVLEEDLLPPGYGPNPSEVIWLLLRGRVAERLGQRDKARRSYQVVADFWRNADPELRHFVDEARQGLARLEGRRDP